jgi:hypothetical protein
MLGQIFTAMRIAIIANQISAKHRLAPSKLSFHHPLAETLFNTLKGESSGVFVNWGVYESGKTTAARQASWRLQESGKTVIFLRSYYFIWQKARGPVFRNLVGIPEDMHDRPFSDFLKADTTVVIDNFDELMYNDTHMAETLQFVRELIKDSKETQKFNVLLVVNSWERAQELVDAGCMLVPADAPARWTRDQLETLYATLPDKVISEIGERKNELLRLSTLSGTPGFLTYEAISDRKRFSTSHAAMHDLEWRRGVKALYGETQLDLAPHVEEGRFPDRNGVYHHDDLVGL